jgi:putative sigma-54 modulation protein
MPVRITAKHTTVSDSTKEHIEKVCAKLDHYFDRIVDCEVVLERRAKHGTAVEIIVKVPQQKLVGRGESDDDNLFKSIGDAYDHVSTQLKKYHDKLAAHR